MRSHEHECALSTAYTYYGLDQNGKTYWRVRSRLLLAAARQRTERRRAGEWRRRDESTQHREEAR
eukprot:6213995-Pleurochrysis_carterae.AAC.5